MIPALPQSDVLLVVPPLAHLTWPSLGVHVLQACAREAGFSVAVLYANVLYAQRIGCLAYAELANSQVDWLLGERLFAEAAWGRSPGDLRAFGERLAEETQEGGARARRYLDQLSDAAWVPSGEVGQVRHTVEELERYGQQATELVMELGQAIGSRGYQVVGATTSFDQTAASLAILTAVKAGSPGTVTLLGGANCEGPMADGLAEISQAGVDHVFSGECEQVFVDFLRGRAAGESSPRILRGRPCRNLDALPTPDYAEYFAQVDALPELRPGPLWISYETSRGCWWGEKSHCTFCGLNGEGMGFREKSAERALGDVRQLLAEHPTRYVAMTDNIMPHAYHRTFIPALREAGLGAHVFYEQKANLSLTRVRALVDAGVKTIQPGIEAVSTSLLRRMGKGVLARQNVALLRYGLACGLMIKWNLLHNFPGDREEDYEETLGLVPLLRHLMPPNALTSLSVDRFSPYHQRPGEHGVSNVRPLPCYAEVFPEGADVEGIAYHFTADWDSATRRSPDLLGRLWAEVEAWRAGWNDDPPVLRVHASGPETWALTDTRGLGGPTGLTLTTPQAAAVLVGGPRDRVPTAGWAIREGYAADLDGWCVPLATAEPDLLAGMERRHARQERPLQVIRGL